MGNTPEYCQISSSSLPYFFKTSFLCVAVIFVASLVLTCFLLFGISTFLPVTICILFLSTIFVVVTHFSNKKVAVVTNNSGENESPICIYCYPQTSQSVLRKEVVMEEQNPELIEPCQQNDDCDMHEYQVPEPKEFPSDSDSSGDFSAGDQSFELGWRCSENVGGQSIGLSESSISQEEEEEEEEEEEDGDGLIEISIPQNNSVDHFNEESKKKSDSSNYFLPESIFRQQRLMEEEVFADQINEVNEEENLIEIDLSMGSIK